LNLTYSYIAYIFHFWHTWIIITVNNALLKLEDVLSFTWFLKYQVKIVLKLVQFRCIFCYVWSSMFAVFFTWHKLKNWCKIYLLGLHVMPAVILATIIGFFLCLYIFAVYFLKVRCACLLLRLDDGPLFCLCPRDTRAPYATQPTRISGIRYQTHSFIHSAISCLPVSLTVLWASRVGLLSKTFSCRYLNITHTLYASCDCHVNYISVSQRLCVT